MTKVFINGDFLDEKDAKVSYEDRGYVFGDGICLLYTSPSPRD